MRRRRGEKRRKRTRGERRRTRGTGFDGGHGELGGGGEGGEGCVRAGMEAKRKRLSVHEERKGDIYVWLPRSGLLCTYDVACCKCARGSGGPRPPPSLSNAMMMTQPHSSATHTGNAPTSPAPCLIGQATNYGFSPLPCARRGVSVLSLHVKHVRSVLRAWRGLVGTTRRTPKCFPFFQLVLAFGVGPPAIH